MKKIVECVPNFSEGKDKEIINAIADAIKSVDGVTLMDVDPGVSTNRTVYTFVGDPDSVVEGALAGARVARKLIDMRHQKGEHPRIGALDVCPFIPVANVTMEDCIECAKKFSNRAATELGIPVYLYEFASENPARKTLTQIRHGEYEGLSKKITLPEWKPDYGKAEFIPEWGATVAGARNFLIAFNINILGTSNQAHRIALNLREAGRSENEPGKLKEVKAIGWYVEEYSMAQISMNLTNYKITAIHTAFEEAKREARALNIGMAGSEIVGLVPLESLIAVADYYIAQENLFIINEEQKIKLVIDRLGLNSISQFEPKKRVIDYMIAEETYEPLASLTVRAFIEEVASRSSAPGGGSVSAAVAAMGSGLGCMVAQLTYGVRKFEHLDAQMRQIIPPLMNITKQLIPLIDADTNAFNDYMDALKLPKNNEEEKLIRKEAMQNGLKKAIDIPLSTMKIADTAWQWMEQIAVYGNIASKSDIEVGVKSLETGIWGAFKNVMINMGGIKDIVYKENTINFANQIVNRAKINKNNILEMLSKREK